MYVCRYVFVYVYVRVSSASLPTSSALLAGDMGQSVRMSARMYVCRCVFVYVYVRVPPHSLPRQHYWQVT